MEMDEITMEMDEITMEHVEATRTAPRPAIILTIDTEKEVPESVCYSEDCRYIDVNLSGFPEQDKYTVECWSRTKRKYSEHIGVSFRIGSACAFGTVGEEVWVMVHGHMSEKITWRDFSGTRIDPGLEGSRSITLELGQAIVNPEICESNDCRYLEVTLDNFPDGDYLLECLVLLSSTGSTELLNSPQKVSRWPSLDDCWYDGHEGIVWVVVDGLESDRIRLPNPMDTEPGTTTTRAMEVTDMPLKPDLSPSWNGETWIVLSWLPHEADSVGDAGVPERFEVRYRLTDSDIWSNSTSRTRYSNGHNAYVYEYYHRLDNLVSYEDYVAEVRECDGVRCSAWSSHFFRTERPVPPAPQEVRVVDRDRYSFTVEWDLVSGAYSYDIYITGGGIIVSGASYDPRYEVNDWLEPGATYTVTVNSCNDLQRHGDYGEEACGPIEHGTTVQAGTLE